MKSKYIFSALFIATIFSCKHKTDENKFTVHGTIYGAPDQKIALEQLNFNREAPDEVDTAYMKNGSFSLSAAQEEEGMYRIKPAKSGNGYIFINDEKDITFIADAKDSGLQGAEFKTRANLMLKNFLIYIREQRNNSSVINQNIEILRDTKNDTAVNAENHKLQQSYQAYKDYLPKYIDTISDPVVAMFALGYSKGIEENKLKPVIAGLVKRYPNNQGIIALVNEYNKIITKTPSPTQPSAPAPGPVIGAIAPELTMKDMNDKPFSLKQLRGKYVLIDFWASWCGPCRRENPNVVAAYNTFKNKNFTVLGVSLDHDKEAWLNAIKQDKLSWQHITDLQSWNSVAVSLYGFEGIPFNVLIDPKGKIVARDLREGKLQETLNQVLN